MVKKVLLALVFVMLLAACSAETRAGGVGQWIEHGSLRIRVNSWNETSAGGGQAVITVHFTMENPTDDPIGNGLLTFTVRVVGRTVHARSWSVNNPNMNSPCIGMVAPGQHSCSIVFDVAAGETDRVDFVWGDVLSEVVVRLR